MSPVLWKSSSVFLCSRSFTWSGSQSHFCAWQVDWITCLRDAEAGKHSLVWQTYKLIRMQIPTEIIEQYIIGFSDWETRIRIKIPWNHNSLLLYRVIIGSAGKACDKKYVVINQVLYYSGVMFIFLASSEDRTFSYIGTVYLKVDFKVSLT